MHAADKLPEPLMDGLQSQVKRLMDARCEWEGGPMHGVAPA